MSAPPSSSEPGEAIPSSSSDGSFDASLQRVTLPAAVPEAAPPARPSAIQFASGRSITAIEADGEERIEVRGADGAIVIALRLGADGPVLSVAGASLEIAAAKRLSLRAEAVHLASAGDLTIEAGGSLFQRARGSSVREIAGLDRATAGEIEIEVNPGGISMRANDDVDIVGERVRLNSDDPPMPRTWEEHRARHALPADVLEANPEGDPSAEDASSNARNATLPDAAPSRS
ncbi:MAG: hypothetical protein U0441_09930 [Polyangiaceae bacterium]